jgi:hypothetical protein
MNELFVRLFLSELRRAGFGEASYDREQERVNISPAFPRFFVSREGGEYLVHYSEESRKLLSPVRYMIDGVSMLVAMWEQSAPMEIEDVARFRNLLDCNGVVLAARDDGDRGLHFVTWVYSYNRQSVGNGHYTTDFRHAAKDFAGRSGLVPKETVVNDTQLGLLRSALAFRLKNDESLSVNDERETQDLLHGLEYIVHEVKQAL